jgi:hypothetical protein
MFKLLKGQKIEFFKGYLRLNYGVKKFKPTTPSLRQMVVQTSADLTQ